MTNEERLKAAGWKRLHQPYDLTMYRWSRDGIDWYTEDEALVEALTAERDAAIARAEAAEALAASRLGVSPELACGWLSERLGGPATSAVFAALRAHAAKVIR